MQYGYNWRLKTDKSNNYFEIPVTETNFNEPLKSSKLFDAIEAVSI